MNINAFGPLTTCACQISLRLKNSESDKHYIQHIELWAENAFKAIVLSHFPQEYMGAKKWGRGNNLKLTNLLLLLIRKKIED